MKHKVLCVIGMVALLALVLTACGTSATETEAPKPTEPPPPTEKPAEPTEAPLPEIVGSSSQGGLLYDKWWKVLGLDEPAEDQPLWADQTTNTRSGADTWRCKECHGWDYKGADGAYGSGSHFTGFPGVLDAADSMAPFELLAWLDGTENSDHDFSVVGEEALGDMVIFLSEGLVDVGPYIDAETKAAVGGDGAHGEELFTSICTACHGESGQTFNFGSDDEPEYVGTIAVDNPWEFIHKVRAGQPGSVPEMPSAIDSGWSIQDVVDVLTYAQALPTSTESAETETSEVSFGGKLYDKWWKVVEQDEPEEDMPIWARQDTNTRSGGDTWRCKECHGWDYMGADGAYGSGSHFTGFPGVFAAQDKSAEDLLAQLTGGIDPDHDFSAIGDEALSGLVVFIQEGLVDISPYIDSETKAAIGGELTNGEQLYAGNCTACHGADGRTLNFGDEEDPEYVGTIALDNPWEFFHKVRTGQPGTSMPAAVDSGWSLQDVADVLTYAQTLPTELAASGSLSNGGQLYDKWWKVIEQEEPEDDMPVWARQDTNTRSGGDTWRCKECHGWDYKGADGAYGSGSHFTGFPGVFDAQAKSFEELMGQLTGAVDPDHDFSMMDEAALTDLVRFLQAGLVDVTPLIDAETKAAIGGDTALGEELYATCAGCHGEDGRTLNFGSDDDPEYVGTIAVDNPWEFFHKVRVGQPGTSMPASLDSGWSQQELLDLLAFAQSLPIEAP